MADRCEHCGSALGISDSYNEGTERHHASEGCPNGCEGMADDSYQPWDD